MKTLEDILKKGLPKKYEYTGDIMGVRIVVDHNHPENSIQFHTEPELKAYNQAIYDMEANLPDLVAEIEKIIKQEVIKEHNLLNRDC